MRRGLRRIRRERNLRKELRPKQMELCAVPLDEVLAVLPSTL